MVSTANRTGQISELSLERAPRGERIATDCGLPIEMRGPSLTLRAARERRTPWTRPARVHGSAHSRGCPPPRPLSEGPPRNRRRSRLGQESGGLPGLKGPFSRGRSRGERHGRRHYGHSRHPESTAYRSIAGPLGGVSPAGRDHGSSRCAWTSRWASYQSSWIGAPSSSSPSSVRTCSHDSCTGPVGSRSRIL